MARPGHQFNISWVTHVANANRPNSPVTCTRSPNQEVEVANLGTGSSAHLSRSRDHGVVDDAEMARLCRGFNCAPTRGARDTGPACRAAMPGPSQPGRPGLVGPMQRRAAPFWCRGRGCITSHGRSGGLPYRSFKPDLWLYAPRRVDEAGPTMAVWLGSPVRMR